MTSQGVTAVLNSVIDSAFGVIPMHLSSGSPSLVSKSYTQSGIGVLIGITGDVSGRMILDGEEEVFGSIAGSMFGIELSGEMLESFTGELGNMIAGNMATKLSERKVSIDITPPTVLVGATKITAFKKGIRVPLNMESKELNVVLILED